MDVKIQTHHFVADSKLVSYVENKLLKLTQFHERITKVDVFLKLDNVAHKIKDKIAEIKVHIPRHDFFVKHSSKSFEQSFDVALDSVITQMKRKKEKMVAWSIKITLKSSVVTGGFFLVKFEGGFAEKIHR